MHAHIINEGGETITKDFIDDMPIIPFPHLKFYEKIGVGQFGEVYRGKFKNIKTVYFKFFYFLIILFLFLFYFTFTFFLLLLFFLFLF